ncbi:Diaminohydroxyphosphoribosylaminopyrimidine deaminase [Caballeronia sordidicola]|uniref:Riboflavin biosynthesis protein RibD n=2 Tax=Caballeronia sordidicola TaxID=196367 RepID=A0A242MCC5_CABSO|nr:Diaminohydroxyphosphoribosylaminopyrimidine deaminase [Caballeronia sordidicola]
MPPGALSAVSLPDQRLRQKKEAAAMFSQTDFSHMERALALAARGMYTTTPNPRVGCVLVKDGDVIGEGFTQPAGQDHAEIRALKDARARGHDPRGATAYVTLEPCSHFGRTPPCVNALIEARVTKVIAAMEDPNPAVSGRGLAILRDAGIDVRCGLLANEAYELNIGFVSRMTRRRPWVRMKVAATLDGRTGLPNGDSQWITGEAARADGHAWRARACAILTGIGTVREDDPQLTVRAVETPRQPQRVLIDSRLDVPLDARILEGAPPWIFCGAEPDMAKAEALRERGIEFMSLTNEQGKVDLPAMLGILADRGINELHVEAGHKLNGSLLREGCIDELLIYLAPSLLGNAPGMFDFTPPGTLEARPHLRFHRIDRMGDDVRMLARFADVKADVQPLT